MGVRQSSFPQLLTTLRPDYLEHHYSKNAGPASHVLVTKPFSVHHKQVVPDVAPIEFDHQLLLDAGKVGDVSSNRVLAAKTVAAKLFAA
ncbi:MAG: hypothetical protein Q8J90_08490 [Gallionella sp.]|nr:hypothetical protein [Gallionella sp.]